MTCNASTRIFDVFVRCELEHGHEGSHRATRRKLVYVWLDDTYTVDLTLVEDNQ